MQQKEPETKGQRARLALLSKIDLDLDSSGLFWMHKYGADDRADRPNVDICSL
jgi:hypothetical protein